MLCVGNTCQDPLGVKKFEFLHQFSNATEHTCHTHSVSGLKSRVFKLTFLA